MTLDNPIKGYISRSILWDIPVLRNREEGVIMLCCRKGRVPGSRRLTIGLIMVVAAVSLMVIVFTPLPSLEDVDHRSAPYSLRHLNQEDNVYTAPLVIKHEAHRSSSKVYNELYISPLSTNFKKDVGVMVIESVPMGDYKSLEVQTSNIDDIAGPVNVASASVATKLEEQKQLYIQPKQSTLQENTQLKDAINLRPMVNIFKAKKRGVQLGKAGKNSQHGFKFTSKQKSTLDKLKPEDRKELEDRTSELDTEERKQLLMMHLLDEISDLERLRRRKQVKRLPSGGEYVFSSPQMPVKFPNSLKKIHPSKWPQIYGVMKNITHYPWLKDPLCSNYSTVFHPPNSLPTAGLASFPSSGNTWTRYLVESASGIYTGSLYDDNDLIEKGMYGEGIIYDSGMTILQKSHGYTTGIAMNSSYPERVKKNHLEELNHNGAIVIRNPFKTLISHRNLDLGIGHTGYALESDFMGPGWTDYVTRQIELWKEFYVDWLTFCYPKNLYVIFYEVLKANPIKEMQEILKFLELPIDKRRLKCVELHTDGHFKRKPNKDMDDKINPYTQPLKDLIYEAIDAVNKILKQTGHKQLPVEKYEIYDKKEAKLSRLLRT